MATKSIKGTTLHSLLGLSFGSSLHSVRDISSSTLNAYRCALSQLQVLIIDEISFVGCNFLHCIDERLRNLRKVDKPFGGISVFCFGDLLQLEPVRDGNVFELCSGGYSNITESVWKFFQMFELNEIMRQKDDSWCRLLRRLRVGKLLAEDYIRLNKLVGKQIPPGTPHACRLSSKVRAHNEKILANHSGEKYLIPAIDTVKGEFARNDELSREAIEVAKTMHEDKTSGLASLLVASVGLPYIVTVNIDKEDGLVNGSLGQLMDISFENTAVKIIWIQFEDDKTGNEARQKMKNIFPTQTSLNWTPIVKIVRTFRVANRRKYSSNLTLERVQFPLLQASALSMHKFQGKNAFNGLASDFESRTAVPALHYMSLSRCPTEEGIYIIGHLFADQIKANEKAIAEMERLENEAPLQFSFPYPKREKGSFNILFHNVQSLSKYYNLIKGSVIYTNCDVVALAESWFLSSDLSSDYELPRFNLQRFDWPGKVRQPAGIALYVHQGVNVLATDERISTTHYVMVEVTTQ